MSGLKSESSDSDVHISHENQKKINRFAIMNGWIEEIQDSLSAETDAADSPGGRRERPAAERRVDGEPRHADSSARWRVFRLVHQRRSAGAHPGSEGSHKEGDRRLRISREND
ncbi:hypothetical protein Ocin01_13688 [Orchesella cincta]|uniref:Uncharacterized protein n=1 Tax=Orchesella cincta TaxID=48709 RepID=A0A1D2MJ17_ORCCI|nr:hypothetical protein Ocin01_13688 [Orchesella cincta]